MLHWQVDSGLARLALVLLFTPCVIASQEAAEKPDALPVLPDIELAWPEKLESKAAFDAWFDKELGEKVADAEKAEGSDRAKKFLAAANQVLSFGFVDAATRKVLGVKSANDASPADIVGKLDKANDLLKKAEAALASDESAEAQSDLATLRAFAAAIGAVLGPNGKDEDVRRDAVSLLAPLSEHSNPRVASAANLWQAVLRSEEGDTGPAFSILPMATTDPKQSEMPYPFFGKLLRCRLLARQAPAAALGLLLQIEERCHVWMEEDERALALRAVAIVRLEILRQWCADDQEEESAKWCRERMADIRDLKFVDVHSVFSLSPVVPVLSVANVQENGNANAAEVKEKD